MERAKVYDEQFAWLEEFCKEWMGICDTCKACSINMEKIILISSGATDSVYKVFGKCEYLKCILRAGHICVTPPFGYPGLITDD